MIIGVTEYKILDLLNFQKAFIPEDMKEFQREPVFILELLLGDQQNNQRVLPVLKNADKAQEFIKKHGLHERYKKIKMLKANK